MPFLGSAQNRSSRVLSISGPNLVALEQLAPNGPFIALTAPTTSCVVTYVDTLTWFCDSGATDSSDIESTSYTFLLNLLATVA